MNIENVLHNTKNLSLNTQKKIRKKITIIIIVMINLSSFHRKQFDFKLVI